MSRFLFSVACRCVNVFGTQTIDFNRAADYFVIFSICDAALLICLLINSTAGDAQNQRNQRHLLTSRLEHFEMKCYSFKFDWH